MVSKSHNWGGTREGAGRPSKALTKPVRIPVYTEELVKSIVNANKSREDIIRVLRHARSELNNRP